MKRNLLSLLTLSLMAVGCSGGFPLDVEKSESGVAITKDSLLINITVVDEAIIHVTKEIVGHETPEVPDYVGLMEPQEVKWDLKKENGELIVETAKVKVTVDKDAIVSYQTLEGKEYVAETADMTYVNREPADGYMLSQSFSVGDEALYGLGQYQSGVMNWKNVPLRLEQFNQEVAIPFVVSTNNYGIYWNNYSVTDFNKPQYEMEFTTEAVLAKGADKVNVPNPDVENVIQAKSKIKDPKNIRTTTFTPAKSGLYTFMVESAKANRMRGNIRLVIDGDAVINYNTVWVPTVYSGTKELEAGKTYNVEFENSGSKIAGQVFYNEPDYNMTAFTSRGGYKIDYFVMVGETPADVLSLNHKLTGKAPMFSRKSYGFWQCRERYATQAELLENAREMRKRRVPVDMIIQDWFYWPEKTKGCEWDRAKYPNPAAMADEVHDLNMEIMVSVWPEVINDPMLKNYDLMGKKLGGVDHLDFFAPDVAAKYYKMLSDSMFHMGINSIWLDGTEPNRKPKAEWETGVGLPFRDVELPYSSLVTKAMYEGKRKEFPNERVVNLARSGFTGQQKYGNVVWSGDVASTWEQFQEQISAGLNYTMAGLPYWSHDIGGFFRDSNSMNPTYDNQYTNKEFIELMTRWFQFGAFSPIFRIHGYVSKTEIWRYGKEFEAMARKFIDLRYQLLPYIYSEAWRITESGHLIMSPLAYYYPEDKNTWGIDDQLFFGESLMVAFPTEYKQREMEVYLPKGDWFDFWTGKRVAGSGEYITVATPFDSVPIFVKAGTVLPYGPKLQYATEPTDKPTQIIVYPGADGDYTLYYDDNTSYDYEKGAYSLINIKYVDAGGELIITKTKDDSVDFAKNPMKFEVVVAGQKATTPFLFTGDDVMLNI